MTPDDPVLDPDVLAGLEQLGIESANPRFMAQLFGLFASNAPGRFERITLAVSARDGATLESLAHTLKSNCAMLGAAKMAAYCRDLEAMGERQAFDEAAALLPAAAEEFARVSRAVAERASARTTPDRPA
jgi:HPt (histidine-containing phosphotransfer) domain-containing protein